MWGVLHANVLGANGFFLGAVLSELRHTLNFFKLMDKLILLNKKIY